MLVLEVAGGVVLGLMFFNWLGYWARKPEPVKMTPELRQAMHDYLAAAPRQGADGKWIWPSSNKPPT